MPAFNFVSILARRAGVAEDMSSMMRSRVRDQSCTCEESNSCRWGIKMALCESTWSNVAAAMPVKAVTTSVRSVKG